MIDQLLAIIGGRCDEEKHVVISVASTVVFKNFHAATLTAGKGVITRGKRG